MTAHPTWSSSAGLASVAGLQSKGWIAMKDRVPEHVQFDHEWHDGALSNVHPLMLLGAVMLGLIGWGALIALALLIVRFLAHLLGTR